MCSLLGWFVPFSSLPPTPKNDPLVSKHPHDRESQTSKQAPTALEALARDPMGSGALSRWGSSPGGGGPQDPGPLHSHGPAGPPCHGDRRGTAPGRRPSAQPSTCSVGLKHVNTPASSTSNVSRSTYGTLTSPAPRGLWAALPQTLLHSTGHQSRQLRSPVSPTQHPSQARPE